MMHPAHYYIRWLFATADPSANSIAFVKDRLKAYDLAIPNDDELKEMGKDLRLPRPFHPRNKKHLPSTNCLRDLRVYALSHPDEHMQIAWEILKNADMRHKAQLLLLSKRPHSLASRFLNSIYPGSFVTVESLEKFEHFFWNKSVMMKKDWILYFNRLNAGIPKELLTDELKEEQDDYRMALVADPKIILHELGVVQAVDPKIAAKDIHDALYWLLLKKLHGPTGPQDIKAIVQLAGALQQQAKVVAEGTVQLGEIMRDMERYQIDAPEKLPVPSLTDVAGNRHSENRRSLPLPGDEELVEVKDVPGSKNLRAGSAREG